LQHYVPKATGIPPHSVYNCNCNCNCGFSNAPPTSDRRALHCHMTSSGRSIDGRKLKKSCRLVSFYISATWKETLPNPSLILAFIAHQIGVSIEIAVWCHNFIRETKVIKYMTMFSL